jgi:GT2 family glycosyltransferase
MKISVGIATAGRWTTLAATLTSLVFQNYRDWNLLIVDDSKDHPDLRKDPAFSNLFKLMEERGNEWGVLFGDGKGGHFSFQKVIDNSHDPLTLLLPDDFLMEPQSLGELHDSFQDQSVGCAAGLVFTPNDPNRGVLPVDWESDIVTNGKIYVRLGGAMEYSNQIQRVTHKTKELKEVDSLIGALCFRTEIGKEIGLNLNLSYVAWGSDNQFTYEFRKRCWKVVVVPGAVFYHFQAVNYGDLSRDSNEYYEMIGRDMEMNGFRGDFRR